MVSPEHEEKSYVIASFTRTDVQSLHLPLDQVERLTDEDLQEIARKMSDVYSDNGYWEDLAFVTHLFLVEKGWSQEQQTLPEEGHA